MTVKELIDFLKTVKSDTQVAIMMDSEVGGADEIDGVEVKTADQMDFNGDTHEVSVVILYPKID